MAEFIPLDFAAHPGQVLQLLDLPPEKLAGLRVGTARLAKGEWVPSEGTSKHAQDEVSIFLRGSATLEADGNVRQVGMGEVIVIPAGEAHRSQALEDCEIFWMLFGESDE